MLKRSKIYFEYYSIQKLTDLEEEGKVVYSTRDIVERYNLKSRDSLNAA